MIQSRLKALKKLPKNGLAIFSGQVYINGGKKQNDICQLLEPPLPITVNNYYCDKRFHVDLISNLYKEHDKIGYIILTSESVIVMVSEGTQRSVLFKRETDIPTESRRGGSSANRISKSRKEKKHNYLELIQEHVVEKLNSVTGIIISGNGELPYEINKRLTNNSKLKTKILGVVKIDLTGDVIENTITKSYEILYEDDVKREKNDIKQIRNTINTDPDKCVFGLRYIEECLKENLIQTLFISPEYVDDFEDVSCQVVVIQYLSYLSSFGGCVGLLYYSGSANYLIYNNDCEDY